MRRQILAASVSLALGGAGDAAAVFLNPQGHGQVLIYPYYTVRSTNGNAFNTYISVVNHGPPTAPRSKVLRVRFREGRNARSVAEFNLYLSANDVWTAAIVPTTGGAMLLTTDTSCTNPSIIDTDIPLITRRQLTFSNASYSGANSDGGDAGLDRTREGFLEVLEMGNLSGTGATAVAHQSSGFPANCAVVQGDAVALRSVSIPTGGLSGTVTLINVANGMDFTANAEALDDVFSGPLYRNYNDPYPDWNAAQVKRLSHITANGKQYRLTWAIAVDAVSSVLTRSDVMNEYIRDVGTLSETDWVFTFPTRRLHVNNFGTAAPFSAPLQAGAVCEEVNVSFFNRDERGASLLTCHPFDDNCRTVGQPAMCYAATVLTVNLAASVATGGVLGSVNRTGRALLFDDFRNGWFDVNFIGANARAGLQSPPSSIARDLATDQGTTGSQAFIGLPVVGFMVRTFVNGTLTCSAGSCQGNYGGLFPHKYRQGTTANP